MNRNLALDVLADLMRWDDVRANEEFDWLDLMSKLKYDGYRELQPGVRFTESLINWLQQFQPSDRETAYNFIRHKLVYVGAAEMQRLVQSFYPEIVQPFLVKRIANQLSIHPYEIWTDSKAQNKLKIHLRKTLFLGLSDGAQTDTFRRSNASRISNEQVAVTTQLEAAKWQDLLDELRKDLGPDAKFSTVYLLDDFVGSGTSLIRQKRDPETRKRSWKGKLHKFYNSLTKAKRPLSEPFFEDNWALCIHHYLAAHQAALASNNIAKRYDTALKTEKKKEWHNRVNFTFGHVFPESFPITTDKHDPFYLMVSSGKYYDPSIENKHNEESGVRDIRFGYAECGLPLILEHNTPNNSVSLLWAESDPQVKKQYHSMRPLFHRRQRHS